MGAFCAAAKAFDTGIMACEFKDVIKKKYPEKPLP
jgi:hypothetical protein